MNTDNKNDSVKPIKKPTQITDLKPTFARKIDENTVVGEVSKKPSVSVTPEKKV